MNEFDKKDIKILEEGILVKNTFFDKEKIADTFNEIVFLNEFITSHIDG